MARKAQEGMEEKISEFIRDFIEFNGYPPSVREIAQGVGIKSTSTVHRYMSIMEEKGMLTRNSLKTRAVKLSDMPEEKHYSEDNMIEVPVVGTVAAGVPITPSNIDLKSAIGFCPVTAIIRTLLSINAITIPIR